MGKQLTARTYNLMLVADEFFRKMRPLLALKFKPTVSRRQRSPLGVGQSLMPMYIATRQQLHRQGRWHVKQAIDQRQQGCSKGSAGTAFHGRGESPGGEIATPLMLLIDDIPDVHAPPA
jgi:hypothetical protein